MKKLNERAVNTLLALLARENPIIDTTNEKTKHIEAKVESTIGRYKVITVTFWEEDSEQDWWRTKEPEITIFHDTQTDEYYPASIIYQNAQVVSSSVTLVYGELSLLNDKIQADHTEITENFLEFISKLVEL